MALAETLTAFSPVLILFAGVIGVLANDLFGRSKNATLPIVVVAIVGAMAGLFAFDGVLPDSDFFLFGAFYRTFSFIALLGTLVAAFAILNDYDEEWDLGVIYSLLLLSSSGGILIAASRHLIPLYVGFELMAIPTYGMVAYKTTRRTSAEAAMKIFLLGAIATALSILGISYLYAATGSLYFNTVVEGLSSDFNTLQAVATILMITGISFKLGLIPFHWWISDVYAGAQISIITYLATGSKKIAFAFAFQLFFFAVPEWNDVWSMAFAVFASLTMVIGNTLAIGNNRVMRIFAYSSIAHAGYISAVFVAYGQAPNEEVKQLALLAAIVHMVANILMKGVALLSSMVVINTYQNDHINNFKGLWTKDKALALSLIIALASLVGIPPFAGFFGKLLIIFALVFAGTTMSFITVGFLIVGSVISIFYYLRFVKFILDDPVDEVELRQYGILKSVSVVLTVVNVIFALIIGYVLAFLDISALYI